MSAAAQGKRSGSSSKKRSAAGPAGNVVEQAPSRVAAIMKAAVNSGLMDAKSTRIAGRISPSLVESAKQRTGIASDSDLIAFALASIALDDDFPDVFDKARGSVDPTLKLGF